MVEIGGRPILWHIMSLYAHHGFREFVVALGYKGEVIKQYFLNSYAIHNDLTIDLGSGATTVHHGRQPEWVVHLVDTGAETMTGGRLARLRDWVGPGTFLATYGDGLGNVPLDELLAFHRNHGRAATVTAVHPPTRFGLMQIQNGRVVTFQEKPAGAEGWVNGGFFVLEPKALDYVHGDEPFERGPMERMTRDGELMAYQHDGFWKAMDTLREKQELEALWASGQAPWRVWE
jgi:glucose-1-phosphate cytidylyltransferase